MLGHLISHLLIQYCCSCGIFFCCLILSTFQWFRLGNFFLSKCLFWKWNALIKSCTCSKIAAAVANTSWTFFTFISASLQQSNHEVILKPGSRNATYSWSVQLWLDPDAPHTLSHTLSNFFWGHCYKRRQNYLIWKISYFRKISNRPGMITGIPLSHTEMQQWISDCKQRSPWAKASSIYQREVGWDSGRVFLLQTKVSDFFFSSANLFFYMCPAGFSYVIYPQEVTFY